MYTWVSVGLPGGVSGKEPAYNARLIRDMGSILGLGRSPGGGNGNMLQYSCQNIPCTEEPPGLQSPRGHMTE